MYFRNTQKFLLEARRVLYPRGQLGLHLFTEDSFVLTNAIVKASALAFGPERGARVFSNPNKCTRDPQAVTKLLHNAGFVEVNIVSETDVKSLSVKDVETTWSFLVDRNSFGIRLRSLRAEELALIKRNFLEEIERLRDVDGFVLKSVTYMYAQALNGQRTKAGNS